MSGARPLFSVDPATGEAWQQWTASSDEEVTAAVERARTAQPAWAGRSLGERRRVMRRRSLRMLWTHERPV